MRRPILPLLSALSLSAPAAAQDIAAGEQVFKRHCIVCHSPQAGKNLVGPSLFGIYGRAAGMVANFRYSAANKDSGKIWDETTLEPYLISPREALPGTTMVFSGVKDPKQRSDLIAYLRMLK